MTAIDRRQMAHPRTDDLWIPPRRLERLQYAAAVLVMGVAVVVSMLAILVVGAVAGAVLGVDMGVVR